MRIEKGTISAFQMTLMVMGMVQGSTLTLSFVYGITKQNTWIATISSFLITLPIIFVYISLMNMFPGKNLIEINNIIYGNILGKIISVFYIFFIFMIAILNLKIVEQFSKWNLLPETPGIVFIIVFTIICGYAVRNGLEVIARCSEILVIISVLVALILIFLLLKEMKLTNFLLIFQLSLRELIQGTHTIASISFAEVVVFFMIAPYINNNKKVKKYLLYGIGVGAINLLLVTFRNILSLGVIGYTYNLSAYSEASIIDVGEVITRMEVLVSLIFFLTLFLKISIFYYAAVLSIAQLFNLKGYKFLVFPYGILAISFANILFEAPTEQIYFASSIFPVFASPFEVVIPIISLALAKVKTILKKG